MAKKGNNRYSKPGTQKQPPATATKQVDIRTTAAESVKAASIGANETDIDQIGVIDIPSSLTGDDLRSLFRDMEEARRLFETQRSRLNQESTKILEDKKKLESDSQLLQSQQIDFDLKNSALEKEKTELEKERKEIQKHLDELSQRESDISRREANARANFLDQYQEVYQQANSQIDLYQTELSRLMGELAEKRVNGLQQLEIELDRIRQDSETRLVNLREIHEKQIEADRAKLEEIRKEIEANQQSQEIERARINRDRSKLETDLLIFQEDKALLEETVNKLVEKNTQRIQEELEYFKERFQEASTYREKYKKSLVAWDEISRKVGKDAETILNYIKTLEAERDSLKTKLSDSATQQDLERLQELEAKKEEWDNERFRLSRELEELHRKLSNARLSVVEHEDLRNENLTLEASRRLLLQRVKELREDIDARLEKDIEGDSPFPRCYSIDHEFSNPTITEPVVNLESLAKQIQMRIANENLYYSDRDIRSLIAGMAMSRMAILQGISGTGKTSLPIHFIKAVGGFCEVIEVQAGWRDRDDLLGHFNSFERKFYEKKFLQALYKASRPTNSDKICIILLDEMNLSYPEQYFADFLSVLERDDQEQVIDLISRPLPGRPVPTGFVDGCRLPVSPNIWFMGTANRDETTKDIADKTYDRSNVLELPVKHPIYPVTQITTSPSTISYKHLKLAFQKAQADNQYQEAVEKAWNFFEVMRPFLGKRMGIGWGNRLKTQLSIYLPVLCASGGNLGEAVDDILALKVLRKVRDRYEIQYKDLEDLLKELGAAWKKVDSKVKTSEVWYENLPRTFDLIDDEQNKKKLRQAEETSI